MSAAAVRALLLALGLALAGPALGQTLYFVQVDHLNTPRLVESQAQQAVWRWEQWEPFGLNSADENPSGFGAFEFPLRFPGQYADKETNLHYNYFRDYDPQIGRYVQSDPIGLRGGINTYAYVKGGPILFADPTGEAGPVGALLGAGIELGLQGYSNYRGGCDVFDASNYDWADVLISAGVGALAPGLIGVGKTISRSGGAIKNLSEQLERAQTVSRAAKIEGRIQRHVGEIADIATIQGAYQSAKAVGTEFNGDRRECTCRP